MTRLNSSLVTDWQYQKSNFAWRGTRKLGHFCCCCNSKKLLFNRLSIVIELAWPSIIGAANSNWLQLPVCMREKSFFPWISSTCQSIYWPNALPALFRLIKSCFFVCSTNWDSLKLHRTQNRKIKFKSHFSLEVLCQIKTILS